MAVLSAAERVMELPKTASDLAVWFGMQFPVLGCAVLLAYLAVRHVERSHERRLAGTERLNEKLLAEKDKQLAERDERIKQLKSEVAELRARRSRTKTPPDAPKPGIGGPT